MGVVERSTFEGDPKPLGKELYAGAVAACGLASGMSLNTTVAPFILRGVTLAGVESGLIPLQRRITAYNRFAPLLTSEKLSLVSEEEKTVGLGQVPGICNKM